MKHAYCIIAHNDIYCLQKLIECLDDPRNDIFIHFDKKSDLFDCFLKSDFSKIYVLPREKSIDIQWGTYSQIEAEITVFKFANENGLFSYFHLLSGQDLPIKNQNSIHSFFDSLPIGTNLVGFNDTSKIDKDNLSKRVVPIHLLTSKLRSPNYYVRFVSNLIEDKLSSFQKKLGIKINKSIEYRKGCNWVSITEPLVEYIINNTDYIKGLFGKAILCDEIFIQTLIWNSHFRDTVYNYKDEYTGCMREIDWDRGSPYTWEEDDYEHLLKSDKLFARKFSSKNHKKIIDFISSNVTSRP